MAKFTLHTEREMSDWYESRSLDENFSYLIPYLAPGARVLDVGCGPGTVTIGVAERVAPGHVTGIEREPKLVERARLHAQNEHMANATFKLGDAYDLPFPDDEFDVTYTRDVMHFLADPVRGLREQRRVTRPNGRIVAFAVDWETFASYPELPTAKKVIASWKQWATASAGSLFVDQFVGSKLFAYFCAAGIKHTDVRGIAQSDYCVVHGTPAFEKWYPHLCSHFQTDGVGRPYYEMLLAQGVLRQEDTVQAMAEIEEWYRDPHAFMSVNYDLAVGRA